MKCSNCSSQLEAEVEDVKEGRSDGYYIQYVICPVCTEQLELPLEKHIREMSLFRRV